MEGKINTLVKSLKIISGRYVFANASVQRLNSFDNLLQHALNITT